MKTVLKLVGFSLATSMSLAAQCLYSIAPSDDEAADSLPLKWTVGVNVGYDDNVTPFSAGSDDSSLYTSAFVRATMTSVSPRTTWDLYAQAGAIYYVDGIDSSAIDDLTPNFRLGLNVTHRVNERLRLSSRNWVAYELEPDYKWGAAGGREVGNYFRWSSDNSVGYRWTDRFATITGIGFYGVNFEDADRSDYTRYQLYNQFRYRVSPVTVLTGSYRYGMTDADAGGETTSHYILGGVEHRISPTSAIVLRAGAQINEPDNGDTTTKPFFEATLRSSLTEQLRARAFVRYSTENWNKRIQNLGNSATYGQNQTFRLGAQLDYAVNPRLSFFVGVNYIMSDYEDLVAFTGNGNTFGDVSEDTLNLSFGGSYQINDNLYLTGSYNYTTTSSDVSSNREYDRNRVQVGVQATF
ncbi:MAG: outer membrane beta-barrel protein [Verrucomicrobiota bacterium]